MFLLIGNKESPCFVLLPNWCAIALAIILGILSTTTSSSPHHQAVLRLNPSAPLSHVTEQLPTPSVTMPIALLSLISFSFFLASIQLHTKCPQQCRRQSNTEDRWAGSSYDSCIGNSTGSSCSASLEGGDQIYELSSVPGS